MRFKKNKIFLYFFAFYAICFNIYLKNNYLCRLYYLYYFCTLYIAYILILKAILIVLYLYYIFTNFLC